MLPETPSKYTVYTEETPFTEEQFKYLMGKYELEELKRLANKGVPPRDLDVHESVIFYTLRYCYKTYRKDPTEATKQRMKEFAKPVIEFHYGRKD